MWTNILFAVFLLTVSIAMIARHRYVWRGAGGEPPEGRERDYQRRQYRRRMQASALIGVVGAMVIGGIWIRGDVLTVIYWCVVLIIVFWMGLLALADMVSSRVYFQQLRKDQLHEHAALRAELHRLQRLGNNGQHDGPQGDTAPNEET